jgi:glycerate kinase
MHILLVPDKFKGTLTALDACAAIQRGWQQARPQDTFEAVPMADGGDGFGEVLGHLLGAERRTTDTTDSAGLPRQAAWYWQAQTKTAIVETAQVNGLALLPPGKFHPFQLDTYGLGAVWRDVLACGAQRVLMGIGGSATNDGGFGMARAVGWRFFDAKGVELTQWVELDRLERIEPPPLPSTPPPETIIAVDVQNPFLGPLGASRVYGGQKGLRDHDFAQAEVYLGRLAEVVRRQQGEDVAAIPGTGAAGGLGFGLKAFFNGQFEAGGAIFARLAQLDERISRADLVVTAEGGMDEQTLMGKGVGVIAQAAADQDKPCICLAGNVNLGSARIPWKNFSAHGIVPELTALGEAKARAGYWLERLSHKIASNRLDA